MSNYKIRYVLGIDPSGNFYEGKGITGWCVYDRKRDKIVKCGSIQASQAKTQLAYWYAHIEMIRSITEQYKEDGVVVSMEDYVLYSRQAKAQINSAMETSQLIGVVKMRCWLYNIPLFMRTASRVKSRWTDNILCNKGYLRKSGSSFFVDCKNHATCDHERDAIRHAVHCATFELEKEEQPNGTEG